jgi:hypothetical protein
VNCRANIETEGELKYAKPFWTNMVKREAMQDIVKEYIETIIVEKCESNRNAPAFLAPKRRKKEKRKHLKDGD